MLYKTGVTNIISTCRKTLVFTVKRGGAELLPGSEWCRSVFTRPNFHVGRLFPRLNMSSKKNKSKSKRGSEGNSSLLSKEDSSLQTSSHEEGSCKTLSSNSFTVIDFIDKGQNLPKEPDSPSAFCIDLKNDPSTEQCGCRSSPPQLFNSEFQIRVVISTRLFCPQAATVGSLTPFTGCSGLFLVIC